MRRLFLQNAGWLAFNHPAAPGYILVPALILLLLARAPTAAFGETRNLYVGDIIVLDIAAPPGGEDEIRRAFEDFEIVGIQVSPGGYRLSLRCFEPGERTIVLGGREFAVLVHSTLDEIRRDTVFEGGSRLLDAGFPFYWAPLLIAAACVFALSGGAVLAKAWRNRSIAPEGPYPSFLRRATALTPDEDAYLVDLTFCFKEYVGRLYGRRIIGKTSSEIAGELESIPALAPLLPFIRKWLTECDAYKFAGFEVSAEEQRLHCERLLKIAAAIDSGEGGQSGAAA